MDKKLREISWFFLIEEKLNSVHDLQNLLPIIE
jgi:hypothetical protein